MSRRHYRPRVYARTPGCGCIGCSVPLMLTVLGAIGSALFMVLR